MARGAHSPGPAALPKVSFVKIDEDISPKAYGVDDKQQRSYGYNDYSEFHRPEPYIRHIEPLESELNQQVEYDMDEQDQEWLDALNQERKKEQLGAVTYETFEIVMDQLEKEWFHLSKKIPKPDMALPSEDSTCAICDDPEGENTNAIVFCDGCNLAVHQDCYGVPYIPEGQWLCRKCTVSPENPVSCILCPTEGGAFKQTVTNEWVHLLCAIWVPETGVANEVFMEPVTGVEKISKQRWRLRCQICDIREGACIQCSKASCFLAFHATCARKDKLLMPMKAISGSEAPTLQCFCDKHLPHEQAELRRVALAAEGSTPHNARSRSNTPTDEDEDELMRPRRARHRHTIANPSPKSSKSARAYTKAYKPGPPIVPALIVNRIVQYISKISVRKKTEFVETVCRYWSLKREARRGAPLLKRLHLEPWTGGSNGMNARTSDEDKAIKLEHMKRLRGDLERVRILAELCRKRESRKLRQTQLVADAVRKVVFSHQEPMRNVFDRISSMDRNDYFKNPVSKTDVPDYHDIVKKPMCWTMIETKLDRYEYWDLDSFRDDIFLVLDNAILYNKAGTPYYKTALRIKTAARSLLTELNGLATSAPSELERQAHPNPQPPPEAQAEAPSPTLPTTEESQILVSDHSQPGEPTPLPQPSTSSDSLHTVASSVLSSASNFPNQVGNLEPPLSFLNLLLSEAVIEDLQDLSEYVLTSAPLPYILQYELGEPVLLPPPRSMTPPTAAASSVSRAQSETAANRSKSREPRSRSVGVKEKPKRHRTSQKERNRVLDASAAFRAPGLRTRRAAAVEAAFEMEAAADGIEPGGAVDRLGGILDETTFTEVDAEGTTSVEPEAEAGGEGGRIRTAPTSEAQVEAQVEIDIEADGELDPEMTEAETSPVHEPFRELETMSSIKPSVEPTARQATPAIDADEDASPGVVERHDASSSSGVPSRSSAKRKRPSHSTGLGAPAIVEDVGKRDTFSRFDTGWILATGQRRGNRKPPEIIWPTSVRSSKKAKLTHSEEPSGSRTTESMAPTEIAVEDAIATSPIQVPSNEEDHAGTQLSISPPMLEALEDDASLHIVTTSPSSPSSPAIDSSPSPKHVTRSRRSIPQPPGSPHAPHLVDPSSVSVTLAPHTTLVRDEDGRMVLEVLDTPKTRRERHMRKKLQLEDPSSSSAPSALGSTSAAGPSHPRVSMLPEAEAEDESELSALSDLDEDEAVGQCGLQLDGQEEVLVKATMTRSIPVEKSDNFDLPEPAVETEDGKHSPSGDGNGDAAVASLAEEDEDGSEPKSDVKSKSTSRPKRRERRKTFGKGKARAKSRTGGDGSRDLGDAGVIRLDEEEYLDGGTLVWAKFSTFPWWPAVIFEPDDDKIPDNILDEQPPTDEKLHLVQFYDKTKSWAWQPLQRLFLLGEDRDFDEQFLSHTRYQRFKNNSVKTECRAAYKRALAEMEM